MDDNKKTHIYDGIVEQNNPMPLWWVALFLLCIGFAFIYWLHYEVANGGSLAQEYKDAMVAYKEKVEKNAPQVAEETEESLMAFMKGEQAVLEGQALFKDKCSMCHGENLEGKIGPNLTDNFWSLGDGSRKAVVHTILKGSAAKGMPAWEAVLKPNEVKSVAAYIFSKHGSNPANAKPPEGTERKE